MKTSSVLVAMDRARRAFLGDQKGVVTVLFTIGMIPIIGLVLFAIDISRLYDLQSQLQKGADSCAMAAAGELDGRTDAQTRAALAIQNLGPLDNTSFWGAGITCGTPAFYASLPASDATALGTPLTNSASDQSKSRFVSITAAPVTVRTFLPMTLLGQATDNLTTSATAVGGFTQTICRVTPIAICNGTGTNNFTNKSAMVGRQIAIVQESNSLPTSTTSKFNFLWVDMMGCGTSAPCLEHHLGWNIVPACKNVNDISPIQGVKAGPQNYYNTRFDLTNPPANNPGSLYSADVNVRKGYRGSSPENPPTSTIPLPNDSAIETIVKNSSTGAYDYTKLEPLNGAVGAGDWQSGFAQYNSLNFQNKLPAITNFTTRYDIYKYEIANGLVSNQSNAPAKETGTPSDPKLGTPTADRRLVYAIVQDCSGTTVNLGTPQAVLKLFALQPLQDPGNSSVFLTEYVDVAVPNSATDGVLHDEVQLYR